MTRNKPAARAARLKLRQPRSVGPGANMGPPWLAGWRQFCRSRAQAAAWKPPDRMIVWRRLARSAALGMSYRDYALEILERGRHL